MKRILLCTFLLPFAGPAGSNSGEPSYTNLVEVRSGAWPMTLERLIDYRDTSYALEFRDQEVANGIAMDTLSFADLGQLKYFQKALTYLKTANNGDIAKFKDYSVKRADKKYDGTWYILRVKWGATDFKQPEADIMIKTIKGL
ncbi:MAG TPA: hypothetical protein VGM89_06105 [Puia sp.]|jgi:hypothetical protein